MQQSQQSTAEQQPETWRFVPDTILLVYQWAPQWVPARTPTVHWGPISGKAVGGPNYSSAQQYSADTRQTCCALFFFVPFFCALFFFLVPCCFFCALVFFLRLRFFLCLGFF